MDHCIACSAAVDTDIDCECYIADGDGQTVCMCERCREDDEKRMEFGLEPLT